VETLLYMKWRITPLATMIKEGEAIEEKIKEPLTRDPF